MPHLYYFEFKNTAVDFAHICLLHFFSKFCTFTNIFQLLWVPWTVLCFFSDSCCCCCHFFVVWLAGLSVLCTISISMCGLLFVFFIILLLQPSSLVVGIHNISYHHNNRQQHHRQAQHYQCYLLKRKIRDSVYKNWNNKYYYVVGCFTRRFQFHSTVWSPFLHFHYFQVSHIGGFITFFLVNIHANLHISRTECKTKIEVFFDEKRKQRQLIAQKRGFSAFNTKPND